MMMLKNILSVNCETFASRSDFWDWVTFGSTMIKSVIIIVHFDSSLNDLRIVQSVF